MQRPDLKLVVSCEHAGNRVPPRYRALFRGHANLLRSHRGWDPGALELARAIAFTNQAQLLANTTTRLLVECNRSIGHAQLFSELTRDLDTAEHLRLLATIYHPHRHRIEVAIRRALRGKRRVVHIAVHTFAPVLDGKRRRAEVGLLYHPRREFEVEVANALERRLRVEAPRLRVRRNYPYKGWTDGLTTTLRGRFPADRYAGIEIEVNQALVSKPAVWKQVRRAFGESVRALLQPEQEFL